MEYEMTALDHKFFNPHVGKVFYILCPDDDRYCRTVFIRRNPFNNTLTPNLSNPVMGIPPDGMPAIHPLMLQRLSRIQPMTTNPY